jgi:hypothetical protein
MSSQDHVDFYAELARLEDALETARADLKTKGKSDPDTAERFRAASDEMFTFRRGIRLLAGRPDVPNAPTGAE